MPEPRRRPRTHVGPRGWTDDHFPHPSELTPSKPPEPSVVQLTRCVVCAHYLLSRDLFIGTTRLCSTCGAANEVES